MKKEAKTMVKKDAHSRNMTDAGLTGDDVTNRAEWRKKVNS